MSHPTHAIRYSTILELDDSILCRIWRLSRLPQIGNDRFGMATCSLRVHQFLNFGHLFSIFKNCILWNSFNSEINFFHALLHQQVTQHHATVSQRFRSLGCLLGYLGFAPLAVSRNLSVCPAAAAAALAVISRLLRTIFGAGRGVESLSRKFISLFWHATFQCNRLALNREHLWCETLSAKTAIPFFLCSDQVDPVDGVLMGLPFTVAVPFLGLDMSVLNSSSASSPKGSNGVKKTVCRPSLLSLPPTMSLDHRSDMSILGETGILSVWME